MEETTQVPSASQASVAPSVEQPVAPSSYSKKNWKKWILIYLVIGAILYGVIYYFFLSKKETNPYAPTTNYPKATTYPIASPTATSLNPNTGNLYNDIKVRLNQVIK